MNATREDPRDERSVQVDYAYVGQELENAARAKNWKRYFGGQIADYVRGRVLEVGAGLGGTTMMLQDGQQSSWVCLEPDARLAGLLQARLAMHPGIRTRVVVGDLSRLEPAEQFDCILYIDVLEHIDDDERELRSAAGHLASGGYLIVLCPALPSLFSELDRALGHYRRYTRNSLAAVFPRELIRVESFYLDSVGVLASLANKLWLHQSAPTEAQVRVWDTRMIPVSRVLDSLIGRSIGRSVVAVAQKSTR